MAPRRWAAEPKSTAVEIRQKANSVVAIERLHPFEYRSVYELIASQPMRLITEQAQAREDYLAWRKESENFHAGVADGERRRRHKLYHFPIPVWRWGTKRKLRADVHAPMPVPADYIELGLRIIKIPDGLKISPKDRALCARVLAKGRKRGRPSTRPVHQLLCEFCHNPFESKRGEQRFCARVCYLEFYKGTSKNSSFPRPVRI